MGSGAEILSVLYGRSVCIASEIAARVLDKWRESKPSLRRRCTAPGLSSRRQLDAAHRDEEADTSHELARIREPSSDRRYRNSAPAG
jgi:hypothetical protein